MVPRGCTILTLHFSSISTQDIFWPLVECLNNYWMDCNKMLFIHSCRLNISHCFTFKSQSLFWIISMDQKKLMVRTFRTNLLTTTVEKRNSLYHEYKISATVTDLCYYVQCFAFAIFPSVAEF